MEKIEIIGRVFKLETKENSIIYTLVTNKSVKIENNTYEEVKTFYSCIFSKAAKLSYKVGDLVQVRGNFVITTYLTKLGNYTSAITIFVADHECIMRKKIDTSEVPSSVIVSAPSIKEI